MAIKCHHQSSCGAQAEIKTFSHGSFMWEVGRNFHNCNFLGDDCCPFFFWESYNFGVLYPGILIAFELQNQKNILAKDAHRRPPHPFFGQLSPHMELCQKNTKQWPNVRSTFGHIMVTAMSKMQTKNPWKIGVWIWGFTICTYI